MRIGISEFGCESLHADVQVRCKLGLMRDAVKLYQSTGQQQINAAYWLGSSLFAITQNYPGLCH